MRFFIDSDGCVFDNMRWKHEHAFLPAFIEVWGLEKWRPLAEKHWYAINLYSKTRGINRFAAFGICLRRLRQEADAALRAALPDILDAFEHFIADPANRNTDAIRDQSESVEDARIYEQALRWSNRVNRIIASAKIPHEPFPGAKDALSRMAETGEVFVVSQAPHATLQAEWQEAGLIGLTTRILGQEFGSKTEQAHAARDPRQLPSLLVGDAPGDEAAASEAGCWFFPIIPGREQASWKALDSLLDSVGAGSLGSGNPVLRQAVAEFHEQLRGIH